MIAPGSPLEKGLGNLVGFLVGDSVLVFVSIFLLGLPHVHEIETILRKHERSLLGDADRVNEVKYLVPVNHGCDEEGFQSFLPHSGQHFAIVTA